MMPFATTQIAQQAMTTLEAITDEMKVILAETKGDSGSFAEGERAAVRRLAHVLERTMRS